MGWNMGHRMKILDVILNTTANMSPPTARNAPSGERRAFRVNTPAP
jgi:hypothetical protein